MPANKNGSKSDKEKQATALKSVKGIKGFVKKTKGAEILKARSKKQEEVSTKQIETIEGLIPTNQIIALREQALKGGSLALNKITDIIKESNIDHVTIRATEVLLKWLAVLTPKGVLSTETKTREFEHDMSYGDAAFGDEIE